MLNSYQFDVQQHDLLKTDLFGTVSKEYDTQSEQWLICRDTTKAQWWTSFIAHYLAKREAIALGNLSIPEAIPELLYWQDGILLRSWQDGEPMQIAQPRHPEYFADALKLLRKLHKNNIAHNDLAKETNWLVTPDGKPALVDFQLARHFKKRTKWFRHCAREDIRYLLKHKRSFCPDALTEREINIVNTPGLPSRIWKQTGKRVYMFITRKIFKWQDREGAYDRDSSNQNHPDHKS